MSTAPRMLFPVTVDPEAIRDHPTDQDRLVHREIVATLQACGVLRMSEADRVDLFDAISGLGDLSKNLWRQLLYALNDLNRLDQDPRMSPVRELLTQLRATSGSSHAVRLVVVGREAAAMHGIDDSTGFQTVDATDIALAASVDRAPSVIDAQSSNFAPGTSRESIAEYVLHPLAARSRSVTVIDPHLFDHLLGTARLRSVNVGGRWTQRVGDHVEWLVSELGAVLPAGATINLVGDYPTERRRDGSMLTKDLARSDITTALEKSLAGRNSPLEVMYTLVQGPKQGVRISNRYLVFDCGFGFLVDHDFYRLGFETVDGPEDFLLSRLGLDHPQRIRDLVSGYANYDPATARLEGKVLVG